MNLKQRMGRSNKVVDSRRISDAAVTNIIIYNSATIGGGMVNSEEENNFEKTIDNFVSKNKDRLMTLSFFKDSIEQLCVKFNCGFNFVDYNNQQIQCYFYKEQNGQFQYNLGWISFIVVRNITRQMIDKLNMGQNI